jgi:hypothetical protein
MNFRQIKLWQVIVGIVVLTIIPSLFVFSLERYTTSNEGYCMTCHYKMWGTDFLVHSNIHPGSVRCPECHANHEEIIPKDYSGHPERINPNCVRCHKEIFEKEDMEGFKYNVLNIFMPHKFHLEEVGALCTDCHFNVKHDKFRPVTNRPRMEVCFECHDSETTNCDHCHPHGASEVLASLPTTDRIERNTCEKCHEGFAQMPFTFYGVAYQHEKHLQQGLDCQECHSNATIHGQIVKSREECMQCHHQRDDMGCVACHDFEDGFRHGVTLTAVPGEPDPMAEIVTCDVCHSGIGEGHSREAVLESCSQCHEEPGFTDRVDEVQNRTKTQIRDLEARFETSRRIAEGLGEEGRQEAQPLMTQTESILNTLKADRSLGFHNAGYAAQLFREAEQAMERVHSMQQAHAAKK